VSGTRAYPPRQRWVRDVTAYTGRRRLNMLDPLQIPTSIEVGPLCYSLRTRDVLSCRFDKVCGALL
jgi:hypothetical protein